jgi:Tfp pilus assembly protein PilX
MQRVNSKTRVHHAGRRGAALMMCMFFIFIVTLLVASTFDTITLDVAVTRNSIDYERALYLANAGVHAVAAELEANPAWRGTVVDGAFPADDTYSATAVTGSVANTVSITSEGVAGAISRTVTAIVQL